MPAAQPKPQRTDVAKLPEIKPDAVLVGRVRTFATNLVIKNKAGFEVAGEELKALNGEIARVEAEKDSVFKPINAGLRAFSALVARALEPLKEDQAAIRRAMRTYVDDEEEKRRAEQRRLDEKAEADRQKLLAAADRNEAKGNEAKADEFRERAQAVVAPVVVAHAAPKIAGVTASRVLRYEITDPSKINPPFMIPDDNDYVKGSIRKTVLAMGEQAPSVIGEGIRVWRQTQIGASKG